MLQPTKSTIQSQGQHLVLKQLVLTQVSYVQPVKNHPLLDHQWTLEGSEFAHFYVLIKNWNPIFMVSETSGRSGELWLKEVIESVMMD